MDRYVSKMKKQNKKVLKEQAADDVFWKHKNMRYIRHKKNSLTHRILGVLRIVSIFESSIIK